MNAPESMDVRQDRFLRLSDVIERVGLSSSSIYRMIEADKFPRQINIGRSSVWSELAIFAWMDEIKQGQS